jgi:phage terminase large subunit-like protein
MAKQTKFDSDEFIRLLSERLSEAAVAPNIRKYKPHEKQYLFHTNQKKKKLYIGGNRSGKSVGGVCEGIWRASATHPYRPELNVIGPTRGRVVGVDFTQGIDKIIIPLYKQWTPPSYLRGGHWDAAFDKGSRTLHFSNGSTIEFMSYDQDLDKFAGTSRHWCHFDEEPPKNIFGECLARLIDTNGDYWITMTPVEGITWVHDDLYEDNVGNPDGDVFVIEINMTENPYLSQEAIANFAKGEDADGIAVRIGGSFVQQGGKVYKNFDPTPGRMQVLKHEISNPAETFPKRDWTWLIALDHGLNNPTAILWAAVNRDGFVVVFDEHYKADWSIDQHAKAIQDKCREHGRVPDLWVADPSIINRTAITKTSILDEYQKYGISWQSGNNAVKDGIVRVKKYFNKAKLINPRYEHELFTRQLAVDPDAKVLEFCKLRVTPNCEKLIWEAKKYRWKTYANKKLQYENNAHDEPHKKDDHAMDALRYMIMTQPDLVGGEALTAGSELDNAMEKLSFANEHVVADPNDLLDSSSSWRLGDPIPAGDNWEYDEHLGGVY